KLICTRRRGRPERGAPAPENHAVECSRTRVSPIPAERVEPCFHSHPRIYGTVLIATSNARRNRLQRGVTWRTIESLDEFALRIANLDVNAVGFFAEVILECRVV